MKKKIYIKEWISLKPYENQTVTDIYYLKICNQVKKAITSNKNIYVLQEHLHPKEIDILICFLTSYLEDIVSETNIWNSFTEKHNQLYNKHLPFYSLEEYYTEEINPQDISFLIWYFLNAVQEEIDFSPYNSFIIETAEIVMNVFDKAWDNAPENKYLKSFYQLDENEDDFYIARELIDTILFKTYLFYPDTSLKLIQKEYEIIEESEDEQNLMMFINENRDHTLHKTHTKLLSLKGKEWAAEILTIDHPHKSHFSNMSPRINGFFLYKGQDDNNIFIDHIASSKQFNLTKKSFDHHNTLNEIDTILFLSIVQWKEAWWFSGVFFQQSFNSDLILDEKNSIQSRKAVEFLDHKLNATSELLEKQLNSFMDFNNGMQIAFMPSEKIEDYIKNYMEYFNESLDLSNKEKEEAKARARKDGYFGTKEISNNFSEVSDSGLVFFNPKSGVEIALAVNCAFPLSVNPYFDVEDSDDDITFLLASEEISTELCMFCIENCKNNLPFFQEGEGKRYLKDIDFLLRFWKKGNYVSNPSITYTGKENNK